MSDHLDLRGIDRRHEPDPQFRAALHGRLVALTEGTDPAGGTEPADVSTIELEPASRHGAPKRRHRWVTPTIALASAAAIVAAIVLVNARDEGTSPADTPPVSSVPNGWVPFAASDTDPDIDLYVGRAGEPPRRIVGSDTDETVEVCPAFSPDRRRLLFGQAAGTEETAFHDAALVIADVTADGEFAEAVTVPLGGQTPPPCGIWSADGRWVAFGVDKAEDPSVHSVDEVWVVDTQSDDIRRLTGLFVTDLDWAPTATDLALIGDRISLYSVTSDEIRPLGGPGTGQQLDWTANLDWSPDGRTIAFTRTRPGVSDTFHDLWLMDADGTNERILVPEVNANHGIGPVWSPDGERIVYQQLCDHPRGSDRPCREEHVVVLLTVNEDNEAQLAGAQEVLPPPQTAGPDGPISWYPWGVTWTRDGTALLYLAWGDSHTDPAIVAVPGDTATPPMVISGDLEPALYFGP